MYVLTHPHSNNQKRKRGSKMTREKNKPGSVETAQGESIEHLIRRVKRELLWVLASSVVAFGLGLLAGNLIKF